MSDIDKLYYISLNKNSLTIYIEAFNSHIKVISSQLLQSNNAALSLRELLPQFIKINSELLNLDKTIDEQDKLDKKE